jgi:transcriptional regulator GlxA family with amidase domain
MPACGMIAVSPVPNRVVIAVLDGVQLLDVTGPAEVFSAAARLRGDPGYTIELVAAQRGPVRTSAGIELIAARDLPAGRIDTVLIPGAMTPGGARPLADPGLVDRIRARHHGWGRVASVCAGARSPVGW